MENKKFLDYAGLVQVFQKIKGGYASLADFNALKDKVGTWTNQDWTTLADAVATNQTNITNLTTSLNKLVGDLDEEELNALLEELLKHVPSSGLTDGNLVTEGDLTKSDSELAKAIAKATTEVAKKGGEEHLDVVKTTGTSGQAIYTIETIDVASKTVVDAILESLGLEDDGTVGTEDPAEDSILGRIEALEDNDTTQDGRLDAIEELLGIGEGDTNTGKTIPEQIEEISGKTDASFVDVEYVSAYSGNTNNPAIVFTTNAGQKKHVDAAPFIKDGMVSNVEITDGTGDNVGKKVLKITFNTDAGTDNIEIEISDIFDADNYYNKTEVDGKVTGLQTQITANKTAIDTLNGEEATAGSVKNTAKTYADGVYNAIISLETSDIEAAFTAANTQPTV